MKKLLFYMTVTLLFSQTVYASQLPSVAAQGAVLIDGDTGRVLWGKNEEKPLTMASTTKIMTAILVLEEGNPDDMVTVSPRAAKSPQVRMNLTAGEQVRQEDLLYAMMLKSYNDAAVALAEHIGGSVEEFCDKMTQKAKEIGAEDTVFGSPNGLDSHLSFEQHHSTAKDMALIAEYALKNPKFVEIINTPSVTLPIKAGEGKEYFITNQNRFLNEYEGAIGVKTGYTNKAGQCFVGAAKRDDVTLITTVLASGWGSEGKEQKWKDTKTLMDYGFENYHIEKIVSKGQQVNPTEVLHSSNQIVTAVLAEDFEGLFSKEEVDRINLHITQVKTLEAPVEKGQKLGTAEVMLGELPLAKIDVVAAESANRYTFTEMLNYLAKKWNDFDLDTSLKK